MARGEKCEHERGMRMGKRSDVSVEKEQGEQIILLALLLCY